MHRPVGGRPVAVRRGAGAAGASVGHARVAGGNSLANVEEVDLPAEAAGDAAKRSDAWITGHVPCSSRWVRSAAGAMPGYAADEPVVFWETHVIRGAVTEDVAGTLAAGATFGAHREAARVLLDIEPERHRVFHDNRVAVGQERLEFQVAGLAVTKIDSQLEDAVVTGRGRHAHARRPAHTASEEERGERGRQSRTHCWMCPARSRMFRLGDSARRIRRARAAALSMPPAPTAAGTAPLRRIKIISMGDKAVGKSCLIKRYCEEKFVTKYVTTIGIDYGVKPVVIRGQNVRINFWDVAGGDEYVEIRNEFYRDVQGAILVYDVTSRASFNALDSWIEEATAHGAKDPIVTVVANKADKKPREVSEAEGRAWANHHGMLFAEASAKDGAGVQQLFEALFTKVCAGAGR